MKNWLNKELREEKIGPISTNHWKIKFITHQVCSELKLKEGWFIEEKKLYF